VHAGGTTNTRPTLARTSNAEDAENYAEVFGLLFSAISALLFALSALEVLLR